MTRLLAGSVVILVIVVGVHLVEDMTELRTVVTVTPTLATASATMTWAKKIFLSLRNHETPAFTWIKLQHSLMMVAIRASCWSWRNLKQSLRITNKLVNISLARHLLHDPLLVVVSQGPAQLVVVHRRSVLLYSPSPRNLQQFNMLSPEIHFPDNNF